MPFILNPSIENIYANYNKIIFFIQLTFKKICFFLIKINIYLQNNLFKKITNYNLYKYIYKFVINNIYALKVNK